MHGSKIRTLETYSRLVYEAKKATICSDFFVLQGQQSVRPNYLAGQEITGNMRAILIDWLVQVQMKFKLLQETMYMTVAIIDRFLQVRESL